MSFIELSKLNNNASHTLLLYELINSEIPKLDWIDLNFQQSYCARDNKFNFLVLIVTDQQHLQ